MSRIRILRLMEYVFPNTHHMEVNELSVTVPMNGVRRFGETIIRSTTLGPDYEWADHTAQEELDEINQHLKDLGHEHPMGAAGVGKLCEELKRLRTLQYKQSSPSQRDLMGGEQP